MNVLTVIFIIIVLLCAYKGFKRGFAGEVTRLTGIFMALVILSIFLFLVASIVEKNMKTTVISIVLIVAASALFKIAKLIMHSLETIAELPIISFLNRLLGLGAGVLEALLIFWMMYVVLESLPLGQIEEQIMEWTNQSTWMINIYNKNYIANWIKGL